MRELTGLGNPDRTRGRYGRQLAADRALRRALDAAEARIAALEERERRAAVKAELDRAQDGPM